MYLFVYGTLMEGFGNNAILKRHGATLSERRMSTKKYRMVNGGFPVLLYPKEGFPSYQVMGEVWHIRDDRKDAALVDLDRLEGEGSMYHRVTHEHPTINMYIGDIDMWEKRWSEKNQAEVFVKHPVGHMYLDWAKNKERKYAERP